MARGRSPDPNRADANGRTPLHHAVANRDASAVQALLESGADYERNDNAGYPPTAAMFEEKLSFNRWIQFDVRKGYQRIYKVFTAFLVHPRCRGSLTFVNQGDLYNGIIDKSLARVKSVLREGGVTKLDIRLADGTTPLHLAAKLGEARIVKELLAHDADPSARDRAGQTPRDLAMANGHAKVVALLGATAKPKPKARRSAKTAIAALEDSIVAEVASEVGSVYELEQYKQPLDTIVMVGDEVSCSAVYLNVPKLRTMKTISHAGGYRVEGRFLAEDDAIELEEESGFPIKDAVRLLMYRVAARLEHDPTSWTNVPKKREIYAVYVDHSMNDIDERWRGLAKQLVGKAIEDYLRAVARPAKKRATR